MGGPGTNLVDQMALGWMLSILYIVIGPRLEIYMFCDPFVRSGRKCNLTCVAVTSYRWKRRICKTWRWQVLAVPRLSRGISNNLPVHDPSVHSNARCVVVRSHVVAGLHSVVVGGSEGERGMGGVGCSSAGSPISVRTWELWPTGPFCSLPELNDQPPHPCSFWPSLLSQMSVQWWGLPRPTCSAADSQGASRDPGFGHSATDCPIISEECLAAVPPSPRFYTERHIHHPSSSDRN